MCVDIFWAFLLMGIFEGSLLTYYRLQIFDWNTELGYNTVASKTGRRYQNSEIVKYLKDKRAPEIPIARKVWIFLSISTGTTIGWILLWLLLFNVKVLEKTNFSFEDIAIFLLTYIGVSGKLHTIPETVQEWFRRS